MVTSIQISHPQELESKLSEALEQVRNNRWYLLMSPSMAVSTSTRCRFAGAEWMKCG